MPSNRKMKAAAADETAESTAPKHAKEKDPNVIRIQQEIRAKAAKEKGSVPLGSNNVNPDQK